MLRLYVQFKDWWTHLGSDESGQDAFEYLLVIGVVMVAVVTAVALGGSGPVTTVWTAVSGKLSSLATTGVGGS